MESNKTQSQCLLRGHQNYYLLTKRKACGKGTYRTMFKSIGCPESCSKIIELVKLSDAILCQLHQSFLFLFKLYLGYGYIYLQIYLFPQNRNVPDLWNFLLGKPDYLLPRTSKFTSNYHYLFNTHLHPATMTAI